MRKFRLFVVGVLMLGSLLALPGLSDAATPSAPYNVFTINGNGWASGNFVLDSDNSQLGVSNAGTERWQFGASTKAGVNPSHWWLVIIQSPQGQQLGVGTYPYTRSADATHAGLDIFGDGMGCNETSGSMTVHELTRDPGTGNLTALAITYDSQFCDGASVRRGEIRWHSSVGYRAATQSVMTLDFADASVGQDTAAKNVTITSVGSDALHLTASSLAGNTPGSFGISNDGCAGVTLTYGQTCTVSVIAHPTGTGPITAQLIVPSDIARGQQSVNLAVNGMPNGVSAGVSPPSLGFNNVAAGQTSPAQTVWVTSNGANALTPGAATITGTDAATFSISADNCATKTLSYLQQCSISVTAHPLTTGAKSATLVIPSNVGSGSLTVPLAVTSVPPAEGTYYPVTPARLLDTRVGDGAPVGKLGPGGTIHLQVTGRGGVPATGVAAVVMNVTVTEPTEASFLTASPAGQARPWASNLNFTPGWTGANAVTVSVGSGGVVDLYNAVGSTHVIADVTGYYASASATFGSGGQYFNLLPERALDTREWGTPLPGRSAVPIVADFPEPGVNQHLRAFAINVTAVDPASPGYLTAWSGQGPVPLASTVNFLPHQVVPNFAIVPTSMCTLAPSCYGLPMIEVYNAASAGTHVVIDVFGVYDDGTLTGGLVFRPLSPTRIVDTRIGQGAAGALQPNTDTTVDTNSVGDADTHALALNVTAIEPSSSTYISVWPGGVPGLPRPFVSNLNPLPGQVVPNAVQVVLGPQRQLNLYNAAGSVHVCVDVTGTFRTSPYATATRLTAQQASTPTPQRLGKVRVFRAR